MMFSVFDALGGICFLGFYEGFCDFWEFLGPGVPFFGIFPVFPAEAFLAGCFCLKDNGFFMVYHGLPGSQWFWNGFQGVFFPGKCLDRKARNLSTSSQVALRALGHRRAER